MGLAEDTMAKLAQRQAAERAVVRDMTRRYDRSAAAAAKAREALEEAEADRMAVLAAWASAPGWTGDRVAECAGLASREVAEAVRSTAARRPGEAGQTPPTTEAEVSKRIVGPARPGRALASSAGPGDAAESVA
jgi:hypothetical protein